MKETHPAHLIFNGNSSTPAKKAKPNQARPTLTDNIQRLLCDFELVFFGSISKRHEQQGRQNYEVSGQGGGESYAGQGCEVFNHRYGTDRTAPETGYKNNGSDDQCFSHRAKASFDRLVGVAAFSKFRAKARHKMNGVIDSDSKANRKHEHAYSLQRLTCENQPGTDYRQRKDIWNQADYAVAERAKFQRDDAKDDNSCQTQALGQIEIYLVKTT